MTQGFLLYLAHEAEGYEDFFCATFDIFSAKKNLRMKALLKKKLY